MHSTAIYMAEFCIGTFVVESNALFQERPEKPDVPWLTTALWNTSCDLEDALPTFKGLTSDIIATPVYCKAGRIEVSTNTLLLNTWKIYLHFFPLCILS